MLGWPVDRSRRVDAIILAGGTGARLGGISKPDLKVAGERMLDLALRTAAPALRVVVVAPPSVAVPADVLRTLEDPPGGGPVAGIAAGLAVLGSPVVPPTVTAASSATDVLVLACDMPGAARAVPELLGAAAAREEERDGAIAVRPDGRRENLVFVADSRALVAAIAAGGARDRSVRSLLATLDLAEMTVDDEAALADIDTWEQHARWERRHRDDVSGNPGSGRESCSSPRG